MIFRLFILCSILLLCSAELASATMLVQASHDAVDTTPVDPPVGALSMAPKLITHGDTVLLSWLESDIHDPSRAREQREEFRLRFSRLKDGAWSPPRTIVEGVPFFANWADVPSIAADEEGTLYAHWLEKVGEGTYAYDVRLARSIDAGNSWTRMGPAHNDGTRAEHGFVSLVPQAKSVQAFWLDGRNMALETEEEEDNAHGHGPGNMTLRTATIGERVTQGLMIDERVCECCGTSAVMTSKGPLVVYRDRGLQEHRDIWMVRYDGMEWTAPKPVHIDGWTIPGCPVNGPAADAKGSGVVVAWYTAANSREQMRAAFSNDDGATFSAPLMLDDQRPMGRVDVVLVDEGEAIVCWLADSGMFGSIVARRIASDGRMGPVVSLARSSSARSSGFPNLAKVGESLLLVWTEDNPSLRVRAATLETGAIPALAD